jgi:hypothetical protein
MPRLMLLLLSALLIGLSACSGQQAPRPAPLLQAEPAHTDLGALRVHYNLFPTLAMNEAVARSYAVKREADRALLVVALRQRVNNEELPAEGDVIATATDLSGKRQHIALRAVRTGPYTDLIGLLDALPRDQLRVELHIRATSGQGNVRFERSF